MDQEGGEEIPEEENMGWGRARLGLRIGLQRNVPLGPGQRGRLG